MILTSNLQTTGSRTTSPTSTTAAPTVVLASPTAIFARAANHDDELAVVSMPWAIAICGNSSTRITISVNGVLGQGITTGYAPSTLPQYSQLSPAGYAVLPFWADLYITANTSQNVLYQIDGTSPSRTVTFEYYTSYYNQANQYYHFQILFYENRANSFTYRYYNITDSGINAVVGYQCQPSKFAKVNV